MYWVAALFGHCLENTKEAQIFGLLISTAQVMNFRQSFMLNLEGIGDKKSYE
jgi:hypothetical protein